MRFIVIPIEDAKIVFSNEELLTVRKSVDGKEIIVHEEILIKKRNDKGLITLPSEDTGMFEWTYPTYEYNSKELNELLSSEEWCIKE